MAALSVMLKTPIQKKLPKKLSLSIDSLSDLSDLSRVTIIEVAARIQHMVNTTNVWDSELSLDINLVLFRDVDMLKQNPDINVAQRPMINSFEPAKVSLVLI